MHDILTSPYLIAVAVAWLLARASKLTINKATGRIRNMRLFDSGGMPSVHTASVMALATIVSLEDGLSSPIFAVAILFAAIVIYDAINVRRATGEQGRAIEELIKKTGVKVRTPFNARGHKLLEVLIGAILGIVVGVVVFFATK